MEWWQTILISSIPATITGLVSYYSALSKAKSAIKKTVQKKTGNIIMPIKSYEILKKDLEEVQATKQLVENQCSVFHQDSSQIDVASACYLLQILYAYFHPYE